MGNVIGNFTYDGKDSRDFGVLVASIGTRVTPQRAIESVYVPGRNGALTIDKGRFDNVNVTYQAMILSNFANQFDEFKAFLFSHKGYTRLEDSFSPKYYRLARMYKQISPSVITFDAAGKFKISFDCDPRRFLKEGEQPLVMPSTATMDICNPTYYDAKPLLRIGHNGNGLINGTVTINDKIVEVENAISSVCIDLETMHAYNGSTNMNSNVSIPNNVVLTSGDNVVATSFTGVTQVEVIPRWWTV